MMKKNFLNNFYECFSFVILIMANKEFGVDFYYNMVFMGLSVILLPIYIIYFIGYHAHPEDSKFGSSWFARIMIFLGFMISYL